MNRIQNVTVNTIEVTISREKNYHATELKIDEFTKAKKDFYEPAVKYLFALLNMVETNYSTGGFTYD